MNMRKSEAFLNAHFSEKKTNLILITFRVDRRRREMYCGHARLCVSMCLSVRDRMPTLLHGPGCNLGQGCGVGVGVPIFLNPGVGVGVSPAKKEDSA